ncbi:MAG: tRNA-dihydrouridine synthase family protein [Treponema sp.]|jgi:tRNA-dihydrouridine synthase|nr:tRNA-dihydrouridine synthase family protein [Treponema sp.]
MDADLLLAPMAELSHRALRELIESFNSNSVKCYFTEMINAGTLLGGGPFEAFYLDNGPIPEKLVYQLVGPNHDQLVKAAALLNERECAGIDINMGCSAPAIRRTGAGVAWMSSVDKAGELIAALRRVTRRRLSVKLRLGAGIEPPEAEFDYLVRFCRRLEACGLDFITLHPRTAREKFRRESRWEYVVCLRDELGIPVAGNGDIADAADLVRHAELVSGAGRTGPVMVGRAAVRQPWIFAVARDLEKKVTEPQPSPLAGEGSSVLDTNLEEIGLRFMELLAKYQPTEFHVSRARRFFGFFCDNLKWGNYVKNLLNREQDLLGVEKAWRKFFEENPEEKALRQVF